MTATKPQWPPYRRPNVRQFKPPSAYPRCTVCNQAMMAGQRGNHLSCNTSQKEEEH